ncbi:MAG: hypothetical protein IJ991_04375 [Thermoguttaceae bacterium]|nr:hypothetical protein [Thermoguttaceae bacterium]
MFLSALDGRDGRGESNDFRLSVVGDGKNDYNGCRAKTGERERTKRSEPRPRRVGKIGETGKNDVFVDVALKNGENLRFSTLFAELSPSFDG